MSDTILGVFIIIFIIITASLMAYEAVSCIKERAKIADEREKNYNDLMNACNEFLDRVNKED